MYELFSPGSPAVFADPGLRPPKAEDRAPDAMLPSRWNWKGGWYCHFSPIEPSRWHVSPNICLNAVYNGFLNLMQIKASRSRSTAAVLVLHRLCGEQHRDGEVMSRDPGDVRDHASGTVSTA